MNNLPPEVVELILEHASRSGPGDRRKSALKFSLVCRQFLVPGLRALYRDLVVSGTRHYTGIKASWHRMPQQAPLIGTRRLFLVVRTPAEGEVLPFEANVDGGVHIEAAKEILHATGHLRSLHIRAYTTINDLFVEWSPLRHLTRLHIESVESVNAAGLFGAMQDMTVLQRLFVSRIESSTQQELPNLPRFPLRSIVLSEASISDRDLLKLIRSCTETLREISLHSCKTVTRRGMVDVLRIIGPGLNSCELRACTFSDEVTNGAAPIGPFLDDIATYCPFLQELQVASDEICTPAILSRALLRLPLRHCELNCRLPHFEPGQLIEVLRMLPIGRLETLFVGPHLKWNDDALARVNRACAQQDIMFSSGLDLDLLGDPPSPPAEEEAAATT